MTDKKIVSVTIGPVQGFISQARKTRDSFSGSKILSDIINFVLVELEKKKIISSEDVVFPSMEIESKPNRFIIILNENYEKEFIVENIVNLARKKFIEISEETYENIFGEDSKPIGFQEQIKDFLEVNWVVLDYNDNNYKSIYKELDSLMGAIKNTRNYNQIRYQNSQIGEKGKKCTICGERNSIFYSKLVKKNKSMGNYKYINKGFVSKNEGLCSVCFTKRYYQFEEGFPSTAEISLMNVLSMVNKDKQDKKIFSHKLLNDIGNKSADLLYEENINIDYIKDNQLSVENVELEKVTSEKQKELLDYIIKTKDEIKLKAEKDGMKFSKYYAIISFDGDSMGEWLSGKLIDEKLSLKEYHKELSKQLGEFAKKTKDIVDDGRGKIIYAGGEDFLAFINGQHIFDVMRDLRELFDKEVNQKIKEYCKKDNLCGEENKNFTFSAGLCISHYKAPLSNSIIMAKKMEAKSKQIDGKNAFSIALFKRSGEIQETTYKWNELGKSSFDIIDNIKNIIENLKNKNFSSKFIYALGRELQIFASRKDDENFDEKTIIDEMIKVEMKRLVTRSASESIKNYDLNINKIVESLENIYDNSDVEGSKTSTKENFMNLLYIITFLAEEVYYDNRN